MQVNFCIPPSDGNGGWDFKKAKFKTAIEVSNIDEYVAFIDFMVDKNVFIEDSVTHENEAYVVVGYDYQVVSNYTYLRIYITKFWN